MGVPTSEVGYTPAMPRREDHEVHKGHVVAFGEKKNRIRRPKRKHFSFLICLQHISSLKSQPEHRRFQVWFVLVFLRSDMKKLRRYYLLHSYGTTAFFQILFYSLFTHRPIILRFSLQSESNTASLKQQRVRKCIMITISSLSMFYVLCRPRHTRRSSENLKRRKGLGK